MGDLDALARELVEAGMPWLPGMRLVEEEWSGRLLACDGTFWRVTFDRDNLSTGDLYCEYHDPVPDLTDWPTVGALLGELVRRAPFPLNGINLEWRLHRWKVHGWPSDYFDTPGEAVGRALLAVLRGGP